MRKKQPMQPVVVAHDGVVRFQPNELVKRLLDWATLMGFGMNQLAQIDAHVGDREQFAQLIGYSVNGFSELRYVRKSTARKAALKAEKPINKTIKKTEK
jgi:hypothetical protein